MSRAKRTLHPAPVLTLPGRSQKMNDLIEKLEAATEGSRELDTDIWSAVRCPTLFNDRPPYTTSLDAALTLVAEGWGWAAAELDEGVPSAVTTNRKPQIKPGTLDSNPDKIDFRTKAATPALALCIAALKARAAGSVCDAEPGKPE